MNIYLQRLAYSAVHKFIIQRSGLGKKIKKSFILFFSSKVGLSQKYKQQTLPISISQNEKKKNPLLQRSITLNCTSYNYTVSSKF